MQEAARRWRRQGVVHAFQHWAALRQKGKRQTGKRGNRALAQHAGRGSALSHGNTHRPTFDEIDTNNDGVVSRAEYAAAFGKRTKPRSSPRSKRGTSAAATRSGAGDAVADAARLSAVAATAAASRGV